MLDKKDKAHGIRARGKELAKERDKYHLVFQRYDAFHIAMMMMADAVESSKPYPLTDIEKYIKAVQKYMKEADLNELRKVFDFIQDDNPDIFIREVLGAKKIKVEEIK